MKLQHHFDELIDRRATDSAKWRKYPADVLPMWIADSDFRSPEPIVKALTQLAQTGVYGYPDMAPGGFEAAAVSWCRRHLNFDCAPDQVDYLPSVGEAIAVAVKAFTKPGDKVLMHTPFYPPFLKILRLSGRLESCSPLLQSGDGWENDWADFERRAADPDCQLFLLCNPHNPTGHCFAREELERMTDICVRNHVVIFSDEVHMDFVYPPRRHASLPSISPAARANSLMAMSPSKTFNTAGLRAASVVCCSPDLQAAYRKELEACRMERNLFGALAYQIAYGGQCDDYAQAVRDYVERNIDFAVDFLQRRIPEIRCAKPQATFLLWLDCSALGFRTQAELDDFFVQKAKVAMNSGAAFGKAGELHVRMNLACPRARVEEALERMESAVKALR